MSKIWQVSKTLTKHLFTTADGVTYAYGRVLGFVSLFLFGLPIFIATVALLNSSTQVDWGAFFAGASPYVAAGFVGVTGLVWGTDKTEPKN